MVVVHKFPVKLVLWVLFIITQCLSSITNKLNKPKIAVIGGGWSGWAAAKNLCENGCDVTLLDAIQDPGAKKELVNSKGKIISPGERGFWYDYPNIANLLKELNISETDVFTAFTNSSFYSPDGLEAVAPVFSTESIQLPSPLGQVFASFTKFKRLPLKDRASIVGMLYAILDLYRDEKTFEAYDRMSAYDLFSTFGVSKRLIDDFLRPTLLVGLFKPPEELSAAVAMELLYYYALAHQSSFDVRWIKNGTVSGNFFRPLSKYLETEYDLKVLGGCKVTKLMFEGEKEKDKQMTSPISNKITSIQYSPASSWLSSSKTLENLDGVVLAVGSTGMRNILSGSPNVCSKSIQLSKAASLRAIDCMSVRLWLDKPVTTGTSVNVFAKFPALRGAGGTWFMLNELQKTSQKLLWGVSEEEDLPVPNDSAVVAIDFYNAGALLPLSDESIVKLIKDDLLQQSEPNFIGANIVDSDVKRYPQAVSWFSPGSYTCRPRTIVEDISNLYTAGDWVVIQNEDNLLEDKSDSPDFVKLEHGSKGLCQERAYVSGLVATNHLLKKLAKNSTLEFSPTKLAKIIPIRQDEIQVKVGTKINRKLLSGIQKVFGGNAPWLR